MSTAKFILPDYPNQVTSGTAYPVNIDAAIKVVSEAAAGFAVHETTPPSLAVEVEPPESGLVYTGSTWLNNNTVITGPSQSGNLPTTYPRLDLVLLDPLTNTVTIANGAEIATGPIAPNDFPIVAEGLVPLAYYQISPTDTQITNIAGTNCAEIRPVRGIPYNALMREGNQTINGELDVSKLLIKGAPWSASVLGAVNEYSLPKSPVNIVTGVSWSNDGRCAVAGNPDGTDADIFYSSDRGKSWIEVSNPKAVPLLDVAYDGISTHIFVGQADGTDAYIVRTILGGGATERSNPKNFNLLAIAYGGGNFVAVGAPDGTDAYIVTSSNGGVSWTEQANNNNEYLLDVIYDGSEFIAVGGTYGVSPYIITSPDGSTWTTQSLSLSSRLDSVAYGNGVYMAVGSNGNDTYIAVSLDKVSWTATNITSQLVGNTYNSIEYGYGMFVISNGSNCYVSGNKGMTWHPIYWPFGKILSFDGDRFMFANNVNNTIGFSAALPKT